MKKNRIAVKGIILFIGIFLLSLPGLPKESSDTAFFASQTTQSVIEAEHLLLETENQFLSREKKQVNYQIEYQVKSQIKINGTIILIHQLSYPIKVEESNYPEYCIYDQELLITCLIPMQSAKKETKISLMLSLTYIMIFEEDQEISYQVFGSFMVNQQKSSGISKQIQTQIQKS